MDQGEFGNASSVADIVEVECEEVYAEKYVTISANELYSRCDKQLYWRPRTAERTDVRTALSGPELHGRHSTTTATPPPIVFGGPSCAAGESLIAAHLDVAPFTTVTTGFTVLPPRPTEPGVFATPAKKVEGEVYSDVATIVQVEFPPVFAEEPVNINASQLYSRCHMDPKLECRGSDLRGSAHPDRGERRNDRRAARQRRQRVPCADRRKLVCARARA